MSSTSSEAALSSSFQYAGQRGFFNGFLWSRMKLFEDRIEFVGWSWTGRHQRTLPLDRVKDLRWQTGGASAGVNFALHLHGGDHIRVHVEAAGLWKHEVESRAPNLDPAEAELPEQSASPTPRSRAA